MNQVNGVLLKDDFFLVAKFLYRFRQCVRFFPIFDFYCQSCTQVNRLTNANFSIIANFSRRWQKHSSTQINVNVFCSRLYFTAIEIADLSIPFIRWSMIIWMRLFWIIKRMRLRWRCNHRNIRMIFKLQHILSCHFANNMFEFHIFVRFA